MNFLDKIYKFDVESKSINKIYAEWGTTREEHQTKMLEDIRRQLNAEAEKR